MNCDEIMERILRLGKKGSRYGLEATKELAKAVGNPHNGLKFVHIAGTNGKGSVLCFTSCVLMAAGYKVGRYVSPAVTDYFERIQINGKNITREEYCELAGYVLDVCERKCLEPTLFEVETVIGFLYFIKKGCQIVVMETGLGGEIDATNIVNTTVASVITSIGLDHVNILGGSIEEIARSKAGIIKKGVPVCAAKGDKAVLAVIKNKADSMGAELHITDSEECVVKECNIFGSVFNYGGFDNIKINMPGKYQVKNAALALDAVNVLRAAGFYISDDAVRKGMERAVWHCRMEVIGSKPLFICDGAHNPHGARALRESLEEFFCGRRLTFILGILKDKDYEGIIDELLPVMGQAVAVTPPVERGLDGSVIAEILNNRGIGCAVAEISEAAGLAAGMAGENGVVVACGSLSYLGEVMSYGESKQNF